MMFSYLGSNVVFNEVEFFSYINVLLTALLMLLVIFFMLIYTTVYSVTSSNSQDPLLEVFVTVGSLVILFFVICPSLLLLFETDRTVNINTLVLISGFPLRGCYEPALQAEHQLRTVPSVYLPRRSGESSLSYYNNAKGDGHSDSDRTITDTDTDSESDRDSEDSGCTRTVPKTLRKCAPTRLERRIAGVSNKRRSPPNRPSEIRVTQRPIAAQRPQRPIAAQRPQRPIAAQQPQRPIAAQQPQRPVAAQRPSPRFVLAPAPVRPAIHPLWEP
jgi:hypothetical protein